MRCPVNSKQVDCDAESYASWTEQDESKTNYGNPTSVSYALIAALELYTNRIFPFH